MTTKLFSKCWKTLSTCEKDDKSYPISFNSSTTYVLIQYADVKGKQHRSVAHDTVVQKRRSAHPSNSCKEHLDPLLKEGQILADAGLNHSMNAATERWASCCSASDTTSASLLLICSSSLTDERRIPWGSRVLCFLMMQKHILTLDAIVLLSCHWQWNSRRTEYTYYRNGLQPPTHVFIADNFALSDMMVYVHLLPNYRYYFCTGTKIHFFGFLNKKVQASGVFFQPDTDLRGCILCI